MVYILYKTSGVKEELQKEKPLTLAEMQELVGGYIEMHTIGDKTLLMNEEGWMNKLRPNPFFREWNLVGDIVEGRIVRDEFVGVR